MNLSSIFLGGIPSDQRKYLRTLFEYYRTEVGIKTVHIPCTGQNTIVKAALEAGFLPEQIFSSDISLFSSILGYYYTDQPIEELDFEVISPDFYDLYKSQEDDLGRVSVLMYIMKYCQLRQEVFYENTFRHEMLYAQEKYLDDIKQKLVKAKHSYEGVDYQIRDVRDYFNGQIKTGKTDLILMNPPAFSRGYEKMFDFKDHIKYDIPVAEFDFNKEYFAMYAASHREESPFLWYTSRDIMDRIHHSEIIYAKENGKDKYSYFMTPNPELLYDFDGLYKVLYKTNSSANAVKYKMYPKDRELTNEDKIQIKEVTKETALYYRDLFAHRLGATVAEIYFAIFVNGMLLSVSGFNTSFLRRLQESYIFENFCFSISHDKYENLNRLSMMCLISGDMYKYLEAKTLKNSAYVELKTFRTVCLTKYRKSKLNNGLLTLESKEKMPNGTYKLAYEHAFYMERTFSDCLRIFLDKDVRIKKSYEEPDQCSYVGAENNEKQPSKPVIVKKSRIPKGKRRIELKLKESE